VPEEDRIEVAIIDESVYVKPCGSATQANALGIPDFLKGMFRAGCLFVTFDLLDCQCMDSTFLGVIADAATATPHRQTKSAVIVNASEDQLRQLRRLGLLDLVKVHEEKVERPGGLVLRRIDLVNLPRTERQRLEKIRQLHEQLASLNEKNRLTFGSFLTMLDEELRSHRRRCEPRE